MWGRGLCQSHPLGIFSNMSACVLQAATSFTDCWGGSGRAIKVTCHEDAGSLACLYSLSGVSLNAAVAQHMGLLDTGALWTHSPCLKLNTQHFGGGQLF